MNNPKKSSGKQILLTLMLTAILLSGFGLVWGVDYYYSTNGTADNVLLYSSDTNADFPVYELGSTEYGDDWTYRTSQKSAITPTTYSQTNYTPVYLGNDTWAFSPDGYVVDTYISSQVEIIVDMPNLDSWVITEIILNITLPDEIDQGVLIQFGHHVNPIAYTTSQFTQDLDENTQVYLQTHNSLPNIDLEIPIPLDKALRIYDLAQEKPYGDMFISILDGSDDGFQSFACEFEIQIRGRQVTGWSEQDSSATALLIAVSLNIIGGIYALDQVDIGGFVRDIPKKRTQKPKSKAKSKRRS